MGSLAKQQASKFVKLLAIGDSKSGKTGSLISLVEAGYKLRILDFDNLLDILRGLVLKQCPDKIDNVEFRPLRDKRKHSAVGPIIDGTPKAFIEGVKMLDHWKYKDDDGAEVDYGPPSNWGPDTILVIDSLSRLCDAAFDFRIPLTPKGSKTGEIDLRATYGDAQDAIEHIIATLTSDSFAANVIVIAHVQYMDLPDGSKKGFPQGVGQKLSPKIPQYFPSVILYTNKAGKRIIKTTSTQMIDLANPKPFEVGGEYPIETGLATIFGILLGKATEAPKAKPTAVTLRRA